MERELTPLQAIRNNYPKTLLTLDRIGVGNRDGIRQENIIDWMLAGALSIEDSFLAL